MYNVISWADSRYIAVVRWSSERGRTEVIRLFPNTAAHEQKARAWCGKQNAAILAERGRGAAHV